MMNFLKIHFFLLLSACPVVLDKGRDCGSNQARVMYAARLLARQLDSDFRPDESSVPAIGNEESEVDGTVDVYGRRGATHSVMTLQAMDVWTLAAKVCCPPRTGTCSLVPEVADPAVIHDDGLKAELDSWKEYAGGLTNGISTLGAILVFVVVGGAVAVGCLLRRLPDGTLELECRAFGGVLAGVVCLPARNAFMRCFGLERQAAGVPPAAGQHRDPPNGEGAPPGRPTPSRSALRKGRAPAPPNEDVSAQVDIELGGAATPRGPLFTNTTFFTVSEGSLASV